MVWRRVDDHTRVDIRQRATAQLAEGTINLVREDLKGMTDSGFATGSQSIQGSASEHDRMCTEGDGLHHIAATTKAAVDDEAQAMPHRLHHRRQHFDRRDADIELATTVVTEDDTVATGIGGMEGIVDVQHTLE